MRDILGSCKFSRISTAGYDEGPTLTPSPPLTLFQKASLELRKDRAHGTYGKFIMIWYVTKRSFVRGLGHGK